MQLRLASADHCPVHPDRLSRSKLQSFPKIISLRRNARSKPTILFLTVPLHSQLMGSSSFRLLRLLSPKHAEVENIRPHICRASSIVLVRGLGRYRTGVWDCDELRLVGSVRHILRRTHRSRLQPSRRLWQILRSRDRARGDSQLRTRHVLRSHRLSNHGSLGPEAASLDVGGGYGGDPASLRAGRAKSAVRHLLQLLGADGILGHGDDLHCARRTSYLQAGAEVGAMGGPR